jgi:FdhD protein
MSPTVSSIDVVRVRDGRQIVDRDSLAVEEPVEIRLHGQSFAVIMRTPGADKELAAGFLLAERVIQSFDDIGTIEHCTMPGPPGPGDPATGTEALGPRASDAGNIVNVTLQDRSPADIERLLAERRAVVTSSSCGLCGRSSIESVTSGVPPVPVEGTVSSRVLAALPGLLRTRQPAFDQTGGLHAAALFTWTGELMTAAEDVGRHNAVDKVIGRRLLADSLPASDTLLAVSGRTSFEIVQKAALAGIPVLAAVSAPSSLAVDLAREAGVTLLGFVRGGDYTIYAHSARVRHE